MISRGVGYCVNSDCEEFAKGVFLLHHGDSFSCPRCRRYGKAIKEKGWCASKTAEIFNEVRVEFNHCPINDIFREIAVLRDENLLGQGFNTYTLQSPIVKTEKRAFAIGEAVMANLNRGGFAAAVRGEDIPRSSEVTLSFDDPIDVFVTKCSDLRELVNRDVLIGKAGEKLRAQLQS
jgi:hypothetical protein